MDKILFRASECFALLTEPKLKKDKEAGLLSETAKTFVKKMWLANNFGYSEQVQTDDMLKGLLCEQDSMQLVQDVLGGEFRSRFNNRIDKGNFIGTPDIVLQRESIVEDIKTSANLRTFMDAELTDKYYCQGQVYLYLTGKERFRLIYCLVKTPDEIIANEKKRWLYKFNQDETNEDYIRICQQLDHNNNLIDNIPKEKRIKVFEFAKDTSFIERLDAQAGKAILYYKTIEL